MSPIPVIDIFAGPGGLGEGFSSLRDSAGNPAFRIRLSVEMDVFAYRTLLLRSFFRQYEGERVPTEYYKYLRGDAPWQDAPLEALLERFPVESKRARAEAWCAELRPDIAPVVDEKIVAALGPARRRPPWVLVGGPPCQAYSLVGRARMLRPMGDRFFADKRHRLYQEYLRLIAVHAPAVFIMENVKGLLSATSKSGSRTFEQIVADLQRPPGSGLRYRLLPLVTNPDSANENVAGRDFVVKSELYGIPQARHRVIILGMLESEVDGAAFRAMRQHQGAACVDDAIGDLPRLRSGLSREPDSASGWIDHLRASRSQAWFKQLRGHGLADVEDTIRSLVGRIRAPRDDRGARFLSCQRRPVLHASWYSDGRLGGVCGHEARGHRADDLYRYLFVAAFGVAREASPSLADFPSRLLPKHRNAKAGVAGGVFSDRFRVQLAGAPASTITSHIAKDGHYFIHPDPTQCRSLTVREAARLQTFPDNYLFEGPRTEQYHQVGNAVPPLLARKIAKVVMSVLGMVKE